MGQADINIFNFIIIGSVFIGLTFGFLLMFSKRINRRANIFLGFLTVIVVLWNIWVLFVDLDIYDDHRLWCLVPLQFSLALGPCLYFYARYITDPAFNFKPRDLLHFFPVLLEIILQFLIANEALNSNTNPVETYLFGSIMPVFQLLAIVSIVCYAFRSLSEIRKYHSWIKENFSNDEQYHLRLLYRLIIIFSLLWLMLVPYTAIDYLFFDFQLTIADYYPIYILMSIITIWISAEAFLKPEIIFAKAQDTLQENNDSGRVEDLSSEVEWLQKEIARNQFFLDPEINLRKLASILDIHPNRLSKVINEGTNTSFTDFINGYRVKSVIDRLHDPKYDHITLLGISFECGFNSKTTFNRVFKKLTGKTPIQYKKDGPIL